MTIGSIILVIVISILSSMLVGRFYLNWQYHESNSGYRQAKIIVATQEFQDRMLRDQGLAIEELRKKHRNSLGIVIEQCIQSFDIPNAETTLVRYPILRDPRGKHGWCFYDIHIRSVITDLNNNAFIGWIPWILNVKRMRTLWYFSHTLEDIIASQELLKNHEIQKEVTIFESYTSHSISVAKTGNPDIDKHIDTYLRDMNTLQHYWEQWKLLL